MLNIIDLEKIEEQIQTIYKYTSSQISLMLDDRASIEVFTGLNLGGIKLQGVCSIHVEQGKIVILQPYDPSNLKPLEDMLQKSNLGYNISIKDKTIYAEKQKLFDDVQKTILLNAKKKQEDSLVNIRKIRQEQLQEIKNHKKEISENIANTLEKKIQKIVDDYSKKIKDIPLNFA